MKPVSIAINLFSLFDLRIFVRIAFHMLWAMICNISENVFQVLRSLNTSDGSDIKRMDILCKPGASTIYYVLKFRINRNICWCISAIIHETVRRTSSTGLYTKKIIKFLVDSKPVSK